MSTPYTPGQVLTAAELNQSFDEKVTGDDAQITGGFVEGVDHVYIIGTADSTTPANGALVVAGGVGIALNLQVGESATVAGSVIVNGTTASTNTTSGALVVAGGVGIGGSVNVGGSISTVGGVTVAGQLIAEAVTDATNPATGALVVGGGVGIGLSLWVGGSANVASNLTVGGNVTVEGSLSTDEVIVLAGGAGIQFPDGTTQTTAGTIEGELVITQVGGTRVITAAEAAANNIFKVTSALNADLVLQFPAAPKTFTVTNNSTGAHNVSAQTSLTSANVSIIQGSAGTLFSDSTGVYATSAASGIGFSLEFNDSTGQTLGLPNIGSLVRQTTAGITTTLPQLGSYPLGKGVVIANRSNGVTFVALQSGDHATAPLTLQPGDVVFYAANPNAGFWETGWYSNYGGTLQVGSIQFGDGSVQSTANSASQPNSTYYTLGTTDTVGSFAAGDTALRTSGFTAPLVNVWRGGLKLTLNKHYTLNADGVHVNLIDAATQNDEFEIQTQGVYNPSTSFAPGLPFVQPFAGATSISYPHTPGFAWLMLRGVFLEPGTDYTDDANGFYLQGWSADGVEKFGIFNLNAVSIANALLATNPIIVSGPLTFSDGTAQASAGLVKANNLSDVPNKSTALANLGAASAANLGKPYGKVTLVNTSPGFAPNTTVKMGSWDTIVFDAKGAASANSWDPVNQRWNPKIPGIYRVTLSATFVTNTSGAVQNTDGRCYIFYNGAAVCSGLQQQTLTSVVAAALTFRPFVSTLIAMNGSTDFLEAWFRADLANSSGNPIVTTDSTFFEIEYVGPA
jgi:hypothetical protein